MSIDVSCKDLRGSVQIMFEESISNNFPPELRRALETDLTMLIKGFVLFAFEVVNERDPNQPGGSRDRILSDTVRLLEQYAIASLHSVGEKRDLFIHSDS